MKTTALKLLCFFIALMISMSITVSAQRSSRTNPDLILFDLKGPVKSVQLDQSGYTDCPIGLFMDNHSFNFSDYGAWRRNDATVGGVNYKVIRDYKGFIVALVPKSQDDSDYTYVIKYNGDQLASIQRVRYGYAWGVTNYGMIDGHLIPKTFITDADAEGGSNGTVRVSDVKYDRYGNWTSRVLTITGEIHPDSVNFRNVVRQRRIITYY